MDKTGKQWKKEEKYEYDEQRMRFTILCNVNKSMRIITHRSIFNPPINIMIVVNIPITQLKRAWLCGRGTSIPFLPQTPTGTDSTAVTTSKRFLEFNSVSGLEIVILVMLGLQLSASLPLLLLLTLLRRL